MSHKYIMYDPVDFRKAEITYANDADEITRLRADLAAVTAERDRLREALEFYGWAEHWAKQPYEQSVIEDDNGRRARAALEKSDDN